MRVLVACEFSGTVRDAFAAKGHVAYSCDLKPSKAPGRHLQGDVTQWLGGYRGKRWDLLIAHPPCTHLAVSGAGSFHKKKDGCQKEALEFVLMLMNAPVEMICIENPVSIISSCIRPPDQKIQPWQFGDPYQKTTCLWLKNLPKLKPTKIVDRGEFKEGGGTKWSVWMQNKGEHRSVTFPGIAAAMADQWTGESVKTGLGIEVPTNMVRNRYA